MPIQWNLSVVYSIDTIEFVRVRVWKQNGKELSTQKVLTFAVLGPYGVTGCGIGGSTLWIIWVGRATVFWATEMIDTF